MLIFRANIHIAFTVFALTGFIHTTRRAMHIINTSFMTKYTHVIMIIILSFDIAHFPYKHAQRRITFDCHLIDVGIQIVL